MLVLSRRKNESVVIADGMIEVFVVEIRGDKVRLGINAPKDISVHRNEIADAIEKLNKSTSLAAQQTQTDISSANFQGV